jgi:hypothetical protein
MSTQDQISISQFEDDPVRISNNTEFFTQGWPGNGTYLNPYLLENLTIYAEDGPHGYSAIDISNTNVPFIIRNCTLRLPAVSYGAAIRLYNVTDGRIMNCTMAEYGSGFSHDLYGIYVSQSSSISITECVIIGCSSGIEFYHSTSCFIGHSTFRDQRYIGIGALLCNDTGIGENMAIGKESPRTEFGIYMRADCLNCSVYSNTVSNYLGSGIRTQGVVDSYIAGNTVTQSGEGLLIQYTNSSRVLSNILTNNQWGILIDSTSYQNSLTNNILGDNNRVDAEDRGVNNSWTSNWYSDYSGIGVYIITGSAYSVDPSPLPQTLHFGLIINAWASLSLIGLIPLGAAIGYHMRSRERSGKRIDRGPSLFFMVLSVLLPFGFSISPPNNPLFQHLKYVVVDVLFTLGISRSPGTDWTVSYYSSSIVSANDQVLLVSIPYLVACILSIILLMGYIRRDIGGKLMSLGIFMIVIVVMVIPLTVSVLLVPITPLLALSIAFWANAMKLEHKEISKTDDIATS